MKEIKITNLIKFYTLLILYKEHIHGYDLIKKLKICTGRNISASHVYPFLDILKKNKIIELKQEGNREKKLYSLTKEGKIFTRNLIDRFSNLVNFNAKAKTCVSCGCKLIEGEYKEKINNKFLYFCCKYCAKSYKSHLGFIKSH